MEPPWATLGLIVANVVGIVLIYASPETAIGLALMREGFAPHQLIGYQFLHVGGMHLVGNMFFLFLFGRYVEARLGPLKFVGAYLLLGIVSGLVWLALGSGMGLAGASGSICGLIGFVLAIAPHNRFGMVFMLAGRFDFDREFEIAVGWIIAWWIGWDLYYLFSGEVETVAFIAHLGGYAAGFGLGYGLSRPEIEDTHWYVEPPPKPGDRTQTKRLHEARKASGANPSRYVGARARTPSREPEPLRTRGVRQPVQHARDDGIEPLREERPHQVVLRALGPDTSPVGVIKLLMKHKGMAPEKAKVLVDAVRAGDEQAIAFETVDQATRFADDARRQDVTLNVRTAPAPQ